MQRRELCYHVKSNKKPLFDIGYFNRDCGGHVDEIVTFGLKKLEQSLFNIISQ